MIIDNIRINVRPLKLRFNLCNIEFEMYELFNYNIETRNLISNNVKMNANDNEIPREANM